MRPRHSLTDGSRGLRTCLLAGLLVGCLTPTSQPCDDGTVCGGSQVCGPQGGCAAPAQVAACDGRAPGDSCDLGGLGGGTCRGSVCVINRCGNGVVDPGEACDDGGSVSGDGCRADCSKIERCGDALLDDGEACDDGNANRVDGCDACGATTWRAEALLQGVRDAVTYGVAYPRALTIDRNGNIYIAEIFGRVLRIDGVTGAASVFAATGEYGSSGDGGPATAARLQTPFGVAVDGLGNVYIAEWTGHRVRRVDIATGTISTVAGNGAGGFAGDGGDARSAQLNYPEGLVVDGLGNLYIGDSGNQRVRRVDSATGIITTFAGTGAYASSGNGGPATAAELRSPGPLALGADGQLCIGVQDAVRCIDAGSGIIDGMAGTEVAGFAGDGGPARDAKLAGVTGLAFDADDNLLISDLLNARIRRVDASTGIIDTIAGSGLVGFAGDGGPPLLARLHNAYGIAIHPDGRAVLADLSNQRVRAFDPTADGVITTVAGTGLPGDAGSDGPATSVDLTSPDGVMLGDGGDLYFVDTGSHRVMRLDAATGLLSTVAGRGTPGLSGDGGLARDAELNRPRGLARDAVGNLFVADGDNHVIRRIDASTGTISSIGTGVQGFAGDGGDAVLAQFNGAERVAFALDGSLLIADTGNLRIRRIDATTGIIDTIAGNGTSGFSGDGGPAQLARFTGPIGLAVDASGAVFVSDSNRVRRIDPGTGNISTVAGNDSYGFAGDGGPAIAATLAAPQGLAIGPAGELLIADTNNDRIRRVDATTGIISTLAGSSTAGSYGDGGPALSAWMSYPRSMAMDGAGTLYIGDWNYGFVRTVPGPGLPGAGNIYGLAGNIDPPGTGPLSVARLADPQTVQRIDGALVFAGGARGVVQTIRAGRDALDTIAGRYPQAGAIGNLARYRGTGFGEIGGAVFDPSLGPNGGYVIAETSSDRLHLVTVVDVDDPRTWTIAGLGVGVAGFADGLLTNARFRQPRGLMLDTTSHALYVADTGNHVVRRIDLAGGLAAATITTLAGIPGTLGYFGDGGAATDALLYAPRAMALAPNGDLFIADAGNHRVRRVQAGSGVITTVVGDGVASSSGEGSPADSFPVNAPAGLALDTAGNLMVTSTTAVRLLPADASGVVDGTGPVLTIYGGPPRDELPAAATSCLTGVVAVDDQQLLVTDGCSGLLVQLTLEAVAAP